MLSRNVGFMTVVEDGGGVFSWRCMASFPSSFSLSSASEVARELQCAHLSDGHAYFL